VGDRFVAGLVQAVVKLKVLFAPVSTALSGFPLCKKAIQINATRAVRSEYSHFQIRYELINASYKDTPCI